MGKFIANLVIIGVVSLVIGCSESGSSNYASSTSKPSVNCGFVKSDSGRKISVGLDCPSGQRCVEKECAAIPGGTYSCSGICR